MAAVVAAAEAVRDGLEELERQRELITSCTVLWRELSDHFSSLERGLQARSDALRTARASLDASTESALASLQRRELSIGDSVVAAASKLDSALSSAGASTEPSDPSDLAATLRSLCARMDAEGFFALVVSRKKEADLLRSELPLLLTDCIDPATFTIDAISRVFPVDRRAIKGLNDYGWACVMILESLVPALADPDPEIGESRPLVTPNVRERAKKIAEEWKEGLEKKGGVEGAKPAEVHTFLQHVVTFGIVEKDEREFYRKLVVGFAWRKQMPKLAVSLGLNDRMTDMIEELIDKGQQLDAINFAYEADLQDKFPPVPLLKSYLKDSKKTPSSILEDRNNHGRSAYNASRREQTAIRAVIKCIEDRKLEAEFSPEGLQKRLEQLENAKVEKKKPSGSPTAPASKRIRASNGGPMPPAKAGRLTNNAYVSSFPVTQTYVRSPSHPTYSPAAPFPYVYDRSAAHTGVYGSRSPPAVRESYGYPTEVVPAAAMPAPYPPAPINYPAYGGYNSGFVPGYQQGYYR